MQRCSAALKIWHARRKRLHMC